MALTFAERIGAVDWTAFHTAYGRAGDVSNQLLRLASPDKVTALKASHELWCGLCHQHAFVSSASLPALPFLLEVLDRSDEATTVEILDILVGFALCTRPDQDESLPGWAGQMRHRLAEELPRFRQLATHQNAEISAFCERLLEGYDDVCRLECHDPPSAIAEFPAT